MSSVPVVPVTTSASAKSDVHFESEPLPAHEAILVLDPQHVCREYGEHLTRQVSEVPDLEDEPHGVDREDGADACPCRGDDGCRQHLEWDENYPNTSAQHEAHLM